MSATGRPRRSGGGGRPSNTWDAHPVLGAGVRLAALLVPVAVAVGTAILLARLLPAATGALPRAAWWVAVLGGSTAALLLTDRLARRLLPLAVLLELSLVFPDRAPSRLRAARTVSVREMDQRLTRLRSAGVHSRPIEAAETLVTLVSILGLHDPRTRGHSERVRALTDLLSTELDLPEEDRIRLRWAALVHDLGKLTVPAEVLNGGRDLTDDQWAGLRRHPEEGVRLVSGLLPWLGDWGRAVGEHHERWDGTGYPKGLAGDDIGYAARIVAVADSFETMTAARSYSKAMSADQAREELTRCAGSQFDPAVVRAFLAVSVGRLRWVLGPLTWLAEVPFVATADRAGQAVKAGAIGAVVGGLVVLGVAPGPGGSGSEETFGSAERAPAYTELEESAAGEALDGDDGVGSGGGLGSGTAPTSVAAGAAPDVLGLQGTGRTPLGLGFGGASSPGPGYGGGRGAGDGGVTGAPRLPGPVPVLGPGLDLPLPEGAAGAAGGPALAPDPAQDGTGGDGAGASPAAGPAPQPAPAPRETGRTDGASDGGPGSGSEGPGGGGAAVPAQPARPGGPGKPEQPATPAQPTSGEPDDRREHDGEDDDDLRDDVEDDDREDDDGDDDRGDDDGDDDGDG